MHKGPISLPQQLQVRCMMLINLASAINLFTVRHFMRVAIVGERLQKNELLFHDLQDLHKLCLAVLDEGIPSDTVTEDITFLSLALKQFIFHAACPHFPCGMVAVLP